MSYSKTRIPGLLAPSTTPGSVVFHGVTPGLRNIVLMGEPVETDGSFPCSKIYLHFYLRANVYCSHRLKFKNSIMVSVVGYFLKTYTLKNVPFES